MPETIYLTDGSMDFVSGVDSGKVPLVQSLSNPNGLRRDQTAWQTNCTNRGGGITTRAGWKYLNTISDGSVLYQGGYLYEPRSAEPFFVFQLGGRIVRIDATAGALPFDISTPSGLTNPPDIERAFFRQAEEFLIIQAGDYGITNPPTLPLFYDSHFLRRSHGITGIVTPGDPNINEIPAAMFMDYYQGRLWYSQIRITSAGDIVGGPSGTPTYNYRDAVLKVTENPLALAGDGFAVPTHAGAIRGLAHSAAIDTALGEGQLFVFTRKEIYALNVPITRAAWIAAGPNNQPLQRIVQLKWGTTADLSIVAVNGDLFYQTMEPGVRTLALAIRDFSQWANTGISRNMNRLNPFQDRALLRFGSGMLFDNRLYQTALPFSTPVSAAHKCLQVLDFDLVNSFQEKLAGPPPPAWEGIVEGLDILEVFSGDFGGLERAFATVVSRDNGTIQLWELTAAERSENDGAQDTRVGWTVETAAFDFRDAFQMKELQGGELWFDRIYGTVDILVEYRSDDDPCWHFWAEFQKCFARTSCEDLVNPVCYPLEEYREGWNKPLALPHPNVKECASNSVRQAMYGHYFQVRLTIKGFARFRGLLLYASPRQRALYNGMVC